MPYRQDAAREPDPGLTPEERAARDRRAARRRLVVMAVGVPLTLVLLATVFGWLLDRSSPHAPPPPSSAPAPTVAVTDPPLSSDGAGADARPRGIISGTVEASCYETCPTYAEAWADVREGREPPSWCVVGTRAGGCTRVETGTCGRHRYVKIDVDPICGGSTRYFDEVGVLTGVVAFAPNHEREEDGAYRDPLRERLYGHIPECELHVTDSTCVKPAR